MSTRLFKRKIFGIVFLIFIGVRPYAQQLQVSLQVTQPSCIKSIGHNYVSQGDGVIITNVTGGVPPYSFTLYSEIGNFTYNTGYFPGLIPGIYLVVVTDALGNFVSSPTNLYGSQPLPMLNISIIDSVSGCTGIDGSLQLTAQGGTAPYLFSIDGGANYNSTGNFTGLSSGNYICLAKDANGCLQQWVSNLSPFHRPPWFFLPRKNNSCNLSVEDYFQRYGGSGTDIVTTSCKNESSILFEIWYHLLNGGYLNNYAGNVGYLKVSEDGVNYHIPDGYNLTVGEYGQVWDSVYNLKPGLFHYYVKDTVTGLEVTYAEAVGASCDIYIDYVYVLASCGASDGALTVKARYGQSPYTYSMDGINFQTDSTFSGLAAGSYAVSVKDAEGNITSSIATVYNKCPKVLADSTPSYCGGNNGTIQAHGYLGTKPYQFSLNGGVYQSDSLFTPLVPGVYTVHIMDAKGFTDSITGISIGSTCLHVSAQVNDATCHRKNATIFATGSGGVPPYLFSIDGVNFQNNNFFYNLDSGNYVLTIKDANRFTDTIHIKISDNTPTINLGNDTSLCPNQTLLLNPNITGANYLWQDNSTNSTYNVTKVGKYYVQATVNGCAVSDTIHVAYLNLSNQIFPTHDTTLCIGNAIALNAQNAGATYLWSNNATVQTQTFNTSGKYWVQVSVSGCSASDTISLHFITGPTVTLPADTSFCTGNSVTLNAGNSGATYLWSNNSTNNSININQSGKYWIAATQYGCTNVDTIQVTQYLTPSVFLGNDTVICEGQTLLLSAPTSISTYQYLWQDNSTGNNYTVNNTGVYSVKVSNQYNCSAFDTINISVKPLPVFSLGNDTALCTATTLQLNINLPKDKFLWNTGNTTSSLTVNNAGLYWLQVSDSGCIKTDTINVSYQPNPQINLGNDTTLCEGTSLLLNATNSNATYQWQDGSAQPTFNVTVKGTYTVKVTGTNGCDTTGKIAIDYITKPIIDLGNDTTLCLTDNLVLNATYPNSSYLWQDNSTQPIYTVKQAGAYKVDVTNICGSTEDSIHVQYQNCDCRFYIPTSFTPNGDGNNDTFKPGYHCFFTNYKMQVFNRFGQTIFSTENPGEGWDGKLSGQNLSTGTYVWMLSYYDTLLKQNVTKKGTIVLIR